MGWGVQRRARNLLPSLPKQMTNLLAREMRAEVRETWTPYRDETFVISFPLLCGINTADAEHSIQRPLPTAVARPGPGTTRACPASCDEPPTKPKVRAGGLGAAGRGRPRPPAPGRGAPSGCRMKQRRAACPPCRAGPTRTSACGRPPYARRPCAGRGGPQCRAASRRRATIRAASAPRAARPGPLAAPRLR